MSERRLFIRARAPALLFCRVDANGNVDSAWTVDGTTGKPLNDGGFDSLEASDDLGRTWRPLRGQEEHNDGAVVDGVRLWMARDMIATLARANIAWEQERDEWRARVDAAEGRPPQVAGWPWGKDANKVDKRASEARIVVNGANTVVMKRWRHKSAAGQLALDVNTEKGWQSFVGKDERECRAFLVAKGFVEQP